MNKIKFYFILAILSIAVISCKKDDDDDIVVTPPKPYAEQYKIDKPAIEDYLNQNYIKQVVDAPGLPQDQDVFIAKIPAGETHPSLMSYLNSPTLPRLIKRVVHAGDVDYDIYTLIIREGLKGGVNPAGGEYPCNVDGVYAGYKGTLLDGTEFDASNNGQALYNLDGSSHDGGESVIRGWSEGFPQFKTGWTSSDDDGTILYNDFGVGVMILPSAFGYYSAAQTDVPAYSPLVFSIKLYALKRYDHDFKILNGLEYPEPDGIPSYLEDLDGDRYVNTMVNGVSTDDTDGDGIPNYRDFDDDGDGYATRGEIKKADGSYYPFDLIPDCDGNIPTDIKKKRHLDKDCHKMSQ